MYNRILLRWLILLGALFVSIGSSFAADAKTGTNRNTITIDGTRYTLNTCSAQERGWLTVKVYSTFPNKTVAERSKLQKQLQLLYRRRELLCRIKEKTDAVSISSPDFSYVANPDFIKTADAATKQLAEKRVALYTNTAASTVDEMISRGILSAEDKKAIKGKIRLTYVNDCSKIDGFTSIGITTYTYNGTTTVTKKLLHIDFNVSVCDNKYFNKTMDETYKHVITHELGHYIYYIKDAHAEHFENICWQWETDKKKERTCNDSKQFVSDYAMNKPGTKEAWDDGWEDYAETFAYRYLGLPYSTTNNTMKSKIAHFNTLFPK